MTPEHLAWIKANTKPDPTGTCREATEAMAAAFLDLRRVRGHYRWSQHEAPWPHWWLVNEAGEIIDPTSAQWPDGGAGVYEEHEGPEPTGKCANCGRYCYPPFHGLCSPACEREYRAYLMAGPR